MKRTSAFLLHLLFLLPALLLMAPGGLINCAFYHQCKSELVTVDYEYQDKYEPIITVSPIVVDQINRTVYVRPQESLTVLLKVFGENTTSYTAEFLLKKDCFEDEWQSVSQWWALFIKVMRSDTNSNDNQDVKTTYEFQVRTSTCVKLCTETVNMQGFKRLIIKASGASDWRYNHTDGNCGHIPHWNTSSYQYTLSCTEASPNIKSDIAPATSTPTNTTLITIIVGGVIAGVVVVAVIVMIVVKRRRAEPTTEAVAMRPQNTESPRTECVNSLYQPAYRQEPAHDNADRQASANSLYETVDRQESVNSLYEPLENF